MNASLPTILRPGLLREAVCLARTVKNRYECVRGLYFRDRAPLAVQFRNGVRWESTHHDSLLFLLEEIVAERCYMPRWFYRPGANDLIVDVGANIGVFAAYICVLNRSTRVVCFEPNPASYNTLLRNVEANKLGIRVHAHQAAVWREEGAIYLESSTNHSSVGQKTTRIPQEGSTSVRCVNLKQALFLSDPTGGPVALLKIDTEGAETDILESADELAMSRVQRIALEYHSDEKRSKCCEMLKGFGFKIRWDRDSSETGICLAWRPT